MAMAVDNRHTSWLQMGKKNAAICWILQCNKNNVECVLCLLIKPGAILHFPNSSSAQIPHLTTHMHKHTHNSQRNGTESTFLHFTHFVWCKNSNNNNNYNKQQRKMCSRRAVTLFSSTHMGLIGTHRYGNRNKNEMESFRGNNRNMCRMCRIMQISNDFMHG